MYLLSIHISMWWWCSSLSVVSDSVTLWTVALQAPLSMGFSRQEYWSGLPFPSPRDLSNPGIEPRSSALQVDSLPSELPGKPPKEFHLIFKLISEKFPLILCLPAKSHELWPWPWVSSRFRVSPGAASLSLMRQGCTKCLYILCFLSSFFSWSFFFFFLS